MSSSRNAAVSVTLLGAWISMGAAVQADGWKIQLQGAKMLGSSYAGRAVMSDDASAVWFNPAAMTRLAGDWVVTAGAPVITYQLLFRDTGSTSLLGRPLTGPATADGGTTAAVPHVYVVKAISDKWRFGFGFNAPYGLGTNYGETWIGRYHATETRLSVFNLNPSLAVRLGERVSAAVGFDLQRSTATVANMIDFGSIGAAAGLPLVPQSHDGRIEFKGFDWAAGWNAGLLIDAGDDTRLGLAFRSRIDHALRGTADFTLPDAVSAFTQGGRVFVDGEAEITLPMPAELSVSASRRLNDAWTLLGDVTWTHWSVFKALRVDFENPLQPAVEQNASWNDSLRIAAGARVRLGRRWIVNTGVGHETSPVPDLTRTPRLPERRHTWISGGASYDAGRRWSFDVHVSHLVTPDAAMRLAEPAAGALSGVVHWRLTVVGVGAVLAF